MVPTPDCVANLATELLRLLISPCLLGCKGLDSPWASVVSGGRVLILQGRLQCSKSIPQGYSTPGQQLGSRPPPCSASSAAVRDWLREENRLSHLRALRPPVSVVYEPLSYLRFRLVFPSTAAASFDCLILAHHRQCLDFASVEFSAVARPTSVFQWSERRRL